MVDRDDSERTVDNERTRALDDAGAAAVRLPERVGRYTVLSKLGEGGMGVVYEAQQESPRRRVAVKVVSGGEFVSEARVRLFQREAETLARLKHASIGAIYESGRTEDGQHFFAMELVRGQTLDIYMRSRPEISSTRELRFRVELLRKIAGAVHYAHQRGVIHRDLKPSNIVVTEQGDGLPEIKILDFGLARITEGDVAAATMTTEIGVIKGTLPYMSPEQARGDPAEIDLRTDVYALGVILYEILSGHRPYDLLSKSLVEAVRVICEEPPVPLRRTLSGVRRLDPDVETIVGKALEKQADRRYDSAAELADDLDRWLSSQPILARPPTAVYQLRKFASRNRTLVGGVVAVIVVLAVGGVLSTVLAIREARQRSAAERAGYVANIVAAEAGLRHFELAEVKRRLAACPPRLRGWEWHHLDFRAEMSERRLMGHSSRIYAIAVSPDGKYFASGAVDPDNRVRLWDAASGEQLREFATGEETPKGGAGVRAVAFTPDGRRLVWGVDDGTVRISNVEDGQELRVLEGHTNRVNAVAITPDGREIFSSSHDGTIRRWDADSGAAGGVFGEVESQIWGLAVCGEGSTVVSGGSDGTVRVWERSSGRELRVLGVGAFKGNYVGGVACSPDGTRIAATGGGGVVQSWNTQTGEPVGSFGQHDDFSTGVAYSPDGSILATTGKDRTVRLWDAATGAELVRLIGHDDVSTAVTFEPGGERLLSVSWDRSLRVWAADPIRFSPVLARAPGGVRSLALSRDGSALVYGELGETGGIGVVDIASGVRLRQIPIADRPLFAMELSPDGTLAATVHEATETEPSLLRIWDLRSDAAADPIATLTGDEIHAAAFIPGSTEILVGLRWRESILRWNYATRTMVSVIETPLPWATRLSVSPDGTRLAASGGSFVRADLVLIDLNTETLIAQRRLLHRDPLAAVANNCGRVAFSPDGTLLASVHLQDFTLRLWNGFDLEPQAVGVGHTEMVRGVVFSEDGSRIATSSMDYSVRVWNGRTGEALLALRDDEASEVWGVRFARDGKTIFSGNRQGTLIAWRTRD